MCCSRSARALLVYLFAWSRQENPDGNNYREPPETPSVEEEKNAWSSDEDESPNSVLVALRRSLDAPRKRRVEECATLDW